MTVVLWLLTLEVASNTGLQFRNGNLDPRIQQRRPGMDRDMSCAVDDERWLYSNWVYLDCGSSVFSVGMHTHDAQGMGWPTIQLNIKGTSSTKVDTPKTWFVLVCWINCLTQYLCRSVRYHTAIIAWKYSTPCRIYASVNSSGCHVTTSYVRMM